MIFYKDMSNLKAQIKKDLNELNDYKVSYNNKIALYNTYLDTMEIFENGAVENNRLDKEELNSRIKIFQIQTEKIDKKSKILTKLENDIDPSKRLDSDQKELIDQYNYAYKEIKSAYINNTIYEDQITKKYINTLTSDFSKTLETIKFSYDDNKDDTNETIQNVKNKEIETTTPENIEKDATETINAVTNVTTTDDTSIAENAGEILNIDTNLEAIDIAGDVSANNETTIEEVEIPENVNIDTNAGIDTVLVTVTDANTTQNVAETSNIDTNLEAIDTAGDVDINNETTIEEVEIPENVNIDTNTGIDTVLDTITDVNTTGDLGEISNSNADTIITENIDTGINGGSTIETENIVENTNTGIDTGVEAILDTITVAGTNEVETGINENINADLEATTVDTVAKTDTITDIDSTKNIDTFIGIDKNKNKTSTSNIYKYIEIDLTPNLSDNNTLLISEKSGKVFLPYKAEDVMKILNRNKSKYKNANEVIKARYTRNFSDYKIPFTSRYSETMKLARKKEKYNLIDSIILSTEMMGKRSLHPAIISACKNLKELEIYIDCLDKKDLNRFKIFNIEYESYPTATKKNTNNKGTRYKI